MKLDRIDYQILFELSKNGRISNKELSGKISLAPSTTHDRVSRLEKEQVIKSVHAEIDLKKVGVLLFAMIFVQFDYHKEEIQENFWKYVEQMENVLGIWSLGGIDDYMLHVGVRNSDQLRELVEHHISKRPGVRRVRTEIVFRHKRKTLPEEFFRDRRNI